MRVVSSRSESQIPNETATWLGQLIERAAARVALIGGHAVNAWHVPRLTEDYDFVVMADRAAIEALKNLLSADGFTTIRNQDTGGASGPDFVRLQHPETHTAIDMLVSKTPLQDRLINRAVMVPNLPFPVATPEDLIVLKLIASRSHDQVDALNLARRDGIDWGYIEAEAPSWGIEEQVAALKAQAVSES